MKILYIHGLGGGLEANTFKYMKKYLKSDELFNIEVPMNPNDAIATITGAVKKNEIELVIGHSLGGFYTMTIPNVTKLLINPAMYAPKDIVNAIGYGTHEYHSQRLDNATHFIIDEQFINDLKKIEESFYSNYKIDNEHKTYAVFSKQDELFSHINDFKAIFNTTPNTIEDGKHSITEEQFEEYVVPMIEEIKRNK